MLGKYTYCMKNGHDWAVTRYSADIFYCVCSICGAKQVKL